MKKQLKKGFTLTELVIVIVIIAILAAVLIPSMTGYVNRAKQSNAQSEASSTYTLLTAWLVDTEDEYGYDAETMATSVPQTTYNADTAAEYNATLSGKKVAGNKVTCDYTAATTDPAADAKYEVSVGEKTLNLVAADVKDGALPTADGDVELTEKGAEDYNALLDGAVKAGDEITPSGDDAAKAAFIAYINEMGGSSKTVVTSVKVTNEKTATVVLTSSNNYTCTIKLANGEVEYEIKK